MALTSETCKLEGGNEFELEVRREVLSALGIGRRLGDERILRLNISSHPLLHCLSCTLPPFSRRSTRGPVCRSNLWHSGAI